MIVQALCLAWAAAVAPFLPLQEPPEAGADPAPAGDVVQAVEYEGLDQVPLNVARELTRVRVGDALDSAQLDKDVAALARSRRFERIHYRVEPVEGGVRVVFEFTERPFIREIRIVGNSKMKTSDLKDDLGFKVGDPVDFFLARQGRDAIAARYGEKGYGLAEVTLDEEALKKGDVVYTVDEGPRIRVSEVRFEGRISLLEDDLKKRIQTKPALWIFRKGVLDEERIITDAAALQAYYREEGFLDAEASYRIDSGAKPEERIVVFTLEEGVRYRIRDIRLEGNLVFSTEELLDGMRSAVGDFVRQQWIDADVQRIAALYGDSGYIERNVVATRIFTEEPGGVILIFQVTEGQAYRVGDVIVRGNTRTQEKVVLREFRLYPPDDLWSLSEARAAEERLTQSQVFDSAKVVPVGDEPGVRDVLIDVVESDKIGDFIFGIGASSNSGLFGTVIYDVKNFDLFDPPRSWSEALSLRAFHGAGQRFRLEATPGTDVTRLRLDFTEPYFLDRPIQLGASAYLFNRGRDAYRERRVGSNVSFGKRFEKGPLTGWAGEAAFRLESIAVDDVKLLSGRDISDAEGTNALTSVKLSLVRDRTDNRFIPSRGDRFWVSYEQVGVFGGEYAFGKLRTGYTWHKTLYVDARERKSVLTLRAESGGILGDAPVTERFYGGGIGSIRGFQFRGVGPRQGIRDYNVGGDFTLLTGAEYSFPVYEDIVRGVIFTDMGTVESSYTIRDWRGSVGVGVRLTLDFLFGPLPIEFDLSWPALSGPEDEEQVFSFYIGSNLF